MTLLITLFIAITGTTTIAKAIDLTHDRSVTITDIQSAAYADPDAFDADRVATEGVEYVCHDLDAEMYADIIQKCSEIGL